MYKVCRICGAEFVPPKKNIVRNVCMKCLKGESTMKEKPEAIQFADDRPMSLDDDLYQWATDAEDMIRSMQSRLEELNKKIEELEKENASLKQDTERHRFAKSDKSQGVVDIIIVHKVWDEDEIYLRVDKADNAIDTAMQAANKEK